MKKEESIVLVIVILVLIYGFYNYKKDKKVNIKSSTTQNLKKLGSVKELPLSEKAITDYIVNVINNGSNRFKFPGREMEGGYIPKSSARDVACYVYELSGRKCTKPYSKNAQLLFSSNCAGCHGNDGKGINGTYPDLTKKRLLGLGAKR